MTLKWKKFGRRRRKDRRPNCELKRAFPALEEPRWKVVLAYVLAGLMLLTATVLLFGCQTAPVEPFVTVTDKMVVYSPNHVSRGIVGRTEGGLVVITPERFAWEEELALENEELKLKLEQERLSNLKP